MFTSILNDAAATLTIQNAAICTVTSLVLGLIIAAVYLMTDECTKGYAATLVILPAIIQIIITMVNGNLGTGIAVMGAFALVRFRSVPGKANEICALVLAMAVGLATGTGYITFAISVTVVIGAVMVILSKTGFGARPKGERILKITIPEDIDYTGAFEDLFSEYTKSCTRYSVKTTNLGSMFDLSYRIVLKDASKEKQFIDDIRSRNGNLTVACMDNVESREAL